MSASLKHPVVLLTISIVHLLTLGLWLHRRGVSKFFELGQLLCRYKMANTVVRVQVSFPICE